MTALDGLRIAVLKVLGDKVTEAALQARAEQLAAMADLGAEKVAASLPDGTKVASITLAGGGKVRACVTDEAAFLAWVREEIPHAIEQRVRPSDRKAILDRLAADGAEVPGVELADSVPYVSVRFTPGGRDAITEAWTSGALTVAEVLALPAGGES